jgi:hypothetical protein
MMMVILLYTAVDIIHIIITNDLRHGSARSSDVNFSRRKVQQRLSTVVLHSLPGLK